MARRFDHDGDHAAAVASVMMVLTAPHSLASG